MKINVVVGLLAVVWITVGAEADWRIYETRNFVVYSEESAKETRKFAHELETYRANLVKALNLKVSLPDQLPLTVFMVGGASKFKDLTDNKFAAGIFTSWSTYPVAVFYNKKKRASYDQDSLQVVLHEYVHHVMRQSVPVFYPMWYSEGMAEFLSTHHVEDGKVEYGAYLLAREWSLAQKQFWFDMDELLNATGEDLQKGPSARGSVFYGQAWLLTHMLMTDPELSPNTPTFLHNLSNGMKPEEALKKNYGLTPKALEKRFRKYHRGARKIKQLIVPATKPTIELMRKGKLGKADGLWAELSVIYHFNGHEDGAAKLRERAQRAFAETGDTRFLWFEIVSHGREEKWDNAISAMEAALESHPDDIYVLNAAGTVLMEREYYMSKDAEEEKRRPVDLKNLKRAQTYLKPVVKADDWDAAVRTYIADTYLMGGTENFEEASFYIKDAYALFPQYFGNTVNYIKLLIHENKLDDACRLVKPLYHLDFPGEFGEKVKEEIKEVLARFPDQEKTCPV